MCDPMTALMAGSTIISAAGKIKEGQANAEAAEYNAEISRINAKRADVSAKDAIRRGILDESRKKAEGTLTRKGMEAGFAAGNIDHTYGSAFDMILATTREYNIDAAIIRTNAAREAEEYDQAAANYRADAKMGVRTAANARTAGFLGGIGVALDGGAGIIRSMA